MFDPQSQILRMGVEHVESVRRSGHNILSHRAGPPTATVHHGHRTGDLLRGQHLLVSTDTEHSRREQISG